MCELSVLGHFCSSVQLSLTVLIFGVHVVLASASLQPAESRSQPVLIDPMNNETVPVGRDAILQCIVKNLQDYKVAFIHIDRQMILTIHNHVITRIPRFTISHDKHYTWSLKITNVQQEDKGHYMCQVNTDPMVSKVGYLDVVVPPEIIDSDSSPSTVNIRENYNASLSCKATGIPDPEIIWKREDGRKIVLKRKKKEGKREKSEVRGEVLDLIRISRTEMGAYLCIANNSVQPAVSKRIILNVDFAPMIWIPNQLIGAAIGKDVTLECITEAMPKAISYWVYNGTMVMTSGRFRTHEHHHSNYKLDLKLHIRNIQKKDFGQYKCLSKNSHGDNEGTIMLYELTTPTEPPIPTVYEDPIRDYDSDDRYAVAHNVNDYEENDDDNDEPMTKDYNSRKQDRNFYSSNNQGGREGQSPSINTNNKNSNSISEKSTGLWNNWQTRGNSANWIVLPNSSTRLILLLIWLFN